MQIKQTQIVLNQARFFARHGVLPQEQETGGTFFVTICATVDFSHSLETDELTDTLSYADLYQIAREEMRIPSKLLEHVAGRIARHILNAHPEVQQVRIEVTKENPPMGAACRGAGVILEATQE